MWLSGMQYPDHNTINWFRSDSLKEVYLDGTKIEANANRYSFVWGRAIKTSKERIKRQLNDLWTYAVSVAREELENNEPSDFEQIDAKKVKQTINQIDQAQSCKGCPMCRKCHKARENRRIDNNYGFRRFMLRGMMKVEIEAGLLAL